AELAKQQKEQAAQAQRAAITAAAQQSGGLQPVIRSPINTAGPSATDARQRDLPFVAELNAEELNDLMAFMGEEEEPTNADDANNAEGPMPPATELPNQQSGD